MNYIDFLQSILNDREKVLEYLQDLKDRKIIAHYQLDGNDVFISPVVSVDYIQLNIVISSDGSDQVSTGKDIRADNQ